MNKINYNIWLHWHITRFCNLNCKYCFSKTPLKEGVINEIKLKELDYFFEKSDHIFRISFTGGEPFLIPNIVEACSIITKKNYISFNTNLISPRLKDFTNNIMPKKVLEIHASLHFDELIEKNLLNKFIDNYKMLSDREFNIKVVQVAYPRLKGEVENILNVFQKENIKVEFSPFFGKYNSNNYPDAYSDSEITNFNLKKPELKKFDPDNNLCNAGHNAAVVFSNGNVYPCFHLKNKIGNIYSSINFEKKLIECKIKKCGCPLNIYDPELFKLALKKSNAVKTCNSENPDK